MISLSCQLACVSQIVLTIGFAIVSASGAPTAEIRVLGSGVGGRAGVARPEIGTLEALTRTFLATKSIVYTDPTLRSPSRTHFANVLERLAGNVSTVVNNGAISVSGYCLSDQAISHAKTAELIWFDRNLSGGAHTWIFNGSEVLKALNSYCGDTRLDVELLAQIRYLLAPNRGPTATGGFQDQKQLGAAFMFLLAKNTPRIWNQLSIAEKNIIDINMEAHLYSTAFTTKDGVAASLGIDGNTSLHRDWNPNFQNGVIGIIVMTALYWGFEDFEAKLVNYNHASFLAKLETFGMTNLLSTYKNPNSPSASTIEASIRRFVKGSIYAFHGLSERDLLGLLGYVIDRTYSASINCGLNNGAGVRGHGKIVQNCNLLPNFGRNGMLSEFAGVDGGGQRSSGHYAYDGFYTLNYIRLALQLFRILDKPQLSTVITITDSGGPTTMDNVINRSHIGVTDLYFKLSPTKGGGYLDYSGGGPDGKTTLDAEKIVKFGGLINLELFNILQRNLGKPLAMW